MESKENGVSEKKKSRLRGENWTQEDKDLFLDIMQQSASIIENKQSDTNTNKRKNLEWINIQSKLSELTGKQRDITQLKGFWRRAKREAKKSITQHRKCLKAAGNKTRRPPSPTPDDLRILAMCPTDFVTDENVYDSDSDSMNQLTSQDVVQVVFDNEEQCNKEKIDSQGMESCAEPIVTVVEEQGDDVDIETKQRKGTTETKSQNFPNEEKQMDVNVKKKEQTKKKLISKAALVESNMEFKRQAALMIQEEHVLKIKFQKQELAHQKLRHKLEIDILLLEKEKKEIELELLKNSAK